MASQEIVEEVLVPSQVGQEIQVAGLTYRMVSYEPVFQEEAWRLVSPAPEGFGGKGLFKSLQVGLWHYPRVAGLWEPTCLQALRKGVMWELHRCQQDLDYHRQNLCRVMEAILRRGRVPLEACASCLASVQRDMRKVHVARQVADRILAGG
jgi:hypothetical protein